MGKINSSFLDGSITFNIVYTANVCDPKPGHILNFKLVDSNFMGLLAKLEGEPLNIVIPKQLHKNKSEFKKIVDVQDNLVLNHEKYTIQCEIIGRRYNLNDNIIFVIAKLLKVLE